MADEPLRRCIHCDDQFLGRGLHNHVRWNGGEHGPKGTLPDGWDIEQYPVVGHRDVEINREADYQSHDRYVCGRCFQVIRGTNGISIHIEQREDGLHENATVENTEYTKFPADTDKKVVRVPHESCTSTVTLSEEEIEKGWSVKVDEVLDIASKLQPRGRANIVVLALRKHVEEKLLTGEKIDPMEMIQIAEDVAREPDNEDEQEKINQFA